MARATQPAWRQGGAYARRLGLFSGTMAVVGGIVGSGIFLNPAIVAQRVGTAPLTIGVWIAGGGVAILGGLIFGELGGRLPRAGGSYAYLREAFGPLSGFLYGWGMLLVIGAGSAAAVAYTFASYAATLFHFGAAAVPAVAALAILTFAVINLLGVQFGAWTQNVFVLLKLAALAGLIVGGVLLAPSGPAPPAVDCGACARAVAPVGLGSTVAAIGGALVPVLFAYGGWQQTNYIAEEIIEPEQNLPRALVLGVLIVVATYLLANLAYLRTLGVDGLAASRAPAVDTVGRIWGDPGRRIMAIGVMVSTAGFLNTATLLQPRIYQAMARDGLFLRSFAWLHPRWRTPVAAIAFQALWAGLLLFSGSYGELLNYVTFTDWVFFGLTAIALLVLRRRDGRPAAGRFRAPGAPWTMLAFAAASAYVVVGSVLSHPGHALRGAALLAAGIPVYWYWARRLPTEPARPSGRDRTLAAD